MAKVHAYRKDTGERVTIPESWLDHPVLSKDFRKTKPSTSSDTTATAKPAPASTTKEK